MFKLKRPNQLKRLRLPLFLLVIGLGLVILGLVTPTVAQQQAPTQTPLPLYALPDSRSRLMASNTLALSRDNRTLVSANMLNNTLSIILPTAGQIAAEIPVGRDPRSVALTDDGNTAVTANRGDDTVSIVDLRSQTVTGTIGLEGTLPYGVVIGDDNQTIYVSMLGSDEVVVADLATRQVKAHIPVPDAPAGLAVWGDFLYLTHFWSGQVTLVYLPQWQVVSTTDLGADVGLSQSIELDVTRGIAYVPQTRSNAQNTNLIFDTTVFPVINTLDLRGLTLERHARLNLDTVDRPLNMPFAAALDRFRNWIYVVNAGSNNVSVIDLNTGQARAHIEVGSNPRGILLNRDNSLLFVHNALDGTVTVIETRTLTEADEIPVSDLTVSIDVLLGAQFFYGAADPQMSANNWISCANCHFDGLSDGRVWYGFPDGPRNTPLLFNLLETLPYNWSGAWDELADSELKIRYLQAGRGLIDSPSIEPALGNPHAGISPDLDTLVTYLTTLQGPLDNSTQVDTAQVKRGQTIFEEQKCADCHSGPAGTNLQRYDVGTGSSPLEKQGATFDTPSLRWLWLSAPYFHDGSAPALRDVFLLPGTHYLVDKMLLDDIEALVAYLLVWPAR